MIHGKLPQEHEERKGNYMRNRQKPLVLECFMQISYTCIQLWAPVSMVKKWQDYKTQPKVCSRSIIEKLSRRTEDLVKMAQILYTAVLLATLATVVFGW